MQCYHLIVLVTFVYVCCDKRARSWHGNGIPGFVSIKLFFTFPHGSGSLLFELSNHFSSYLHKVQNIQTYIRSSAHNELETTFASDRKTRTY